MRDPASRPELPVYSVSRLNREARTLLEGTFPLLWVEGEVSNFHAHTSGHWYFTLKDESAQVRCAMFRNRNRPFLLEDGMHLRLYARISLYEARGEFQLIVEAMEELGDGALLRAFEGLKRRLSAEGLFDARRKRPLPSIPRTLGVITSPDGAALRDILSVARRRFPAVPILIYPTPVQGEGAGKAVKRAIERAGAEGACDVLILARGGGSLEDLWTFNEEEVARAIAACPIPIVTGIGHEVDFTLADLAADVRAPTPSAAAERALPDQGEIAKRLDHLEARLAKVMERGLERRRARLLHLERRIEHPKRRLEQLSQRLDGLTERLERAPAALIRTKKGRLAEAFAHLQRLGPLHLLQHTQTRCRHLEERLERAALRLIEERRHRLQNLARSLSAVNPLATLERGYALAFRLPEKTLLRRASDAHPGDTIEVRLGQGRLLCRVEETSTTPGFSQRLEGVARARRQTES